MRRFLVTTAAVIATAQGTAHAQDQSAQPPVTTGDRTTVPSRESAGSSADAGARAAADVGPGGSADAGANPQDGLGDIVITAQHKVETAQRAAVAISVVSGADVTAAGITDARDLSKLVPALTIQNIGPSNTSFIRGVGNFSVSVTADPAVAFNYDGVYIGRQTATSGTFYDLDRVEVLKGPQGTLYGRNATAGVINVLPTQPKLGQLGGYVTGSYGNYNALNAEGALNVPLGRNAALRVSGTVTNRDGYLNDGTSDSKSQALRVQMKAKVSPDLTVRIAGDYTHLGGKGVGFTWVDRQIPVGGPVAGVLSQNFLIIPTGFSRSEGANSPASQAFFTSLGAGAGAGIAGRKRDPFPPLFQNSDFFGVNADIVYNMGSTSLTIIPAARWDHIRNRNGAGGFPIVNDQTDHQYSLEVRLAGKVSLFDYTLGGFYYDESNNLRSGSITFGSNYSAAAPTHQHVRSWAPFARLTANVAEHLRLVGGIRYTNDKKQLDAHAINITPGCTRSLALGGCPDLVLPTSVTSIDQLPFAVPSAPGTIPGPTPFSTVSRADTLFNVRVKNTKVTWRGAVEYDVAPASLLYASVETGFRSGGFNTLVGFETFQPEYITAFTAGSKNRFLNNRVQLNIEAFYWKYRNQQVSHPSLDRSVPPRPGSLTENIGRSTIKGVEVEGRFLLTRNTELSSTVAYLDARNKEFSFTIPAALGTLTGCPVAAAATPGFVTINCAGKPSYNAPKWAINLAAQQTIPLGAYNLVLGVDTQFKSKRYLGFEYQPQQLQNASWTTNAQISFGPADRQWSLSAFVRNIEGHRLLVAPFVFGGLSIAYTGAPRTYGVRGTVKF